MSGFRNWSFLVGACFLSQLLLRIAPADADVVILKGGQKLKGDVVEKGSELEVKTSEGPVIIPKSDVVRTVPEAEVLVARAEELHGRARGLFAEALKIENDVKKANATLREAVDLLRKAVEIYRDARDVYDDEKHAYLDQAPITLLQEMRLYRDKMKSELADATPADPSPPPSPAPTVPPAPPAPSVPPKKQVDVGGLTAKAQKGDLEAAYALGLNAEEEQKLRDAAKWYQMAADKGHARAQYRLAMLLSDGCGGIKEDVKEALRLYQKAAAQGLAIAKVRLAHLYFGGRGVSKGVEKADSLCGEAHRTILEEASRGDLDSTYELGWMYSQGLGVSQKSTEFGMELLRRASDKGNYRASYVVGLAYVHGSGVSKDMAEATQWFEKAAASGWAMGCWAAGRAYDELFLPLHNERLDYAKAAQYYKRGADQGDARCQMLLANLTKDGNGVDKDPAGAILLYRAALLTANEAFEKATYNNLGTCYERGLGVKQDMKEAMQYYQKAAERGDLTAQYNMGYLMAKESKDKDAAAWFEKSARQGLYLAQERLGLCYMDGKGVKKNLDEAERWLLAAVQQGDAKAKEYLAKVRALKASK